MRSTSSRRGEFITRRFNGGLNYAHSYGLTASELRDGGDFDIFESGAIGSRRALKPFGTNNIGQPVLNSYAWQDKEGHDHMFAVLSDGVISVASSGSTTFAPSVFGLMVDSNSRCVPHFWSAGGYLYVSDGYKVWRWEGVGHPTYDDVTTVFVHPTSITPVVEKRGVPANCAATTYQNTVFIGNTLVWMTDPDAVWWSAAVAEQPDGSPHEGELTGQEDFYEDQRITFISGPQADEIVALVAAGPVVYVFKRHSISAMASTGGPVYSNDISTHLGLSNPNAWAVSGNEVYFFDDNEGLHVISGNSAPQSVFDPIYPLLDCGRISHTDGVAVGVDGDRVFVSCCLDSDAGVNNVTFVLNTKISAATSRGGAWSRWDVGFTSFTRWQPQSDDSSLVGFTSGANDTPMGAVRLNECSSAIVDDWGFATRVIEPWFLTAFFDDALPTVRKRWERVTLHVSGSDRVKLSVSAESGLDAIPLASCNLPDVSRPRLPHNGQGYVDVDLATYDCSTSARIVDTDSWGDVEDNGLTMCETPVATNEVSGARVVRIAYPGRGVVFAVEVRDNGSEAAWSIEELDVKYQTILEYT